MTVKSNILKIVEEDILRMLKERKEVQPDNLKGEIRVSYFYVPKAIKELKKKRLIYFRQGFLGLTETGERIAENILKRYLMVESYFKRMRSGRESHNLADILEHYVSKEVIKNLKLLSTLKKKGNSLTKFRLFENLLIVDISVADSKLFERMVSIGLLPGETIRIINENSNGVIVEIKNKKFALGEDIAKEIKVTKL